MLVYAILLASQIEGSHAQAAGGTDKYASVHTLAIVSELGNDIYVEDIGFTRLGYTHYTLQLEWDLDRYIGQRIADLLRGRFTVVPSRIDPKIFAQRPLLGHLTASAANELQAKSDSGRPDAYVVVYPDSVIAGEPEGVVVSHQRGLFGKEHNSLAAVYQVSVIDGRTGTRIDYGTAKFPATGFLTGKTEPLVHCDSALWAPSPERLTEKQKNTIKSEITALIEESLPYALSGANLISDDEADRQFRALDQSGSSCRPGLE
jgi:hypothetical protein